MALPILDGNQAATTLSTIFTAGAHIPAHTVVSLGSQAISDISSAVSGISVSVEGTQTVTGSVSILNFPSTQAIQGTVTVGNAVTISSLPASTVTVSNLPTTQTIAGTVTANLNDPTSSLISGQIDDALFGSDTLVNALNSNLILQNNIPVSGTVTISNSTTAGAVFVKICGERNGAGPNEAREIQTDDNGFLFVNLIDPSSPSSKAVIYDPVLGGSYVNVKQVSAVTIGSLPAISGTVTANNPSGALTTRFGSVATANLAFITSAVTNTSRKYLLAQNISAGTVTIGIGFSPTTTQGIQLTAGGGLTFDAFCPTGAVYWLGAVTGAAFTILEG